MYPTLERLKGPGSGLVRWGLQEDILLGTGKEEWDEEQSEYGPGGSNDSTVKKIK